MKKIYMMALAALLFSSCGEDFLDKEPKNTVDPETNVTDDVAVALANACYRTLQSSNMYNQRIWTLDIVAGNSIVGQTVRMYTVGNEKTVEGFVMLAAEPASVTFICLDGQMPREQLEIMISDSQKKKEVSN